MRVRFPPPAFLPGVAKRGQIIPTIFSGKDLWTICGGIVFACVGNVMTGDELSGLFYGMDFGTPK